MKKFTRLFFSMKFALILLGILVAACVAGSVIPQGEAASYYMSAYSEKRGAAILALAYFIYASSETGAGLAIGAFLCPALALVAVVCICLPAKE